jgi:hypothetical protein
MEAVVVGVLALGLLAAPTFSQSSSGTWNDLPDRVQLDAGYFRISANTVLRYNGPQGGGDVNFEKDLGVNKDADTAWVDTSWRLARRHQLKLSYTRLNRGRAGYEIQRDFTWGGETYTAGLGASSTTGNDILGGYYRFALYRNDRFEIGPTLGVGYLWLRARIRATGTVTGPGGSESRTLDHTTSVGSVTGAVGGYASAWPAKRLALRGDFLYIRVTPGDTEAAVTDWRVGLDYYIVRSFGIGAQYKFYRYSYDRGILVNKLGGEVTFEGFQLLASFLF